MKLYDVKVDRLADASYVVTVRLAPTLSALPRVEQERVIEQAMWVASEAVKTATDPAIEEELAPILAALDRRRAANAA